jgi:hypothetical protein
MTAINFPDEPVDEEIFTSGNRSWQWNEASEVWESVVTSIPDYREDFAQEFLTMGA